MSTCKKCLIEFDGGHEFICPGCTTGIKEIPGVRWDEGENGSVGISDGLLDEGLNLFTVPIKRQDGSYTYPELYFCNKEALLEKYGPIREINKNAKMGVYVPVEDLPGMRYDLIRDRVENGNKTA